MKTARFLGLCLAPAVARAVELARFEIKEPLGRDWRDEWLTREVQADLGGRALHLSSLQLKTSDGEVLPAQFYAEGKAILRVLFRTSLKKDEARVLLITDEGKLPPPWPAFHMDRRRVLGDGGGEGASFIRNGIYEAIAVAALRAPIEIVAGSRHEPLFHWAWPKGAEPTTVSDEWPDKGPARAVLKRTFAFKNPEHRYEITFDFRAADPWIDIAENRENAELVAQLSRLLNAGWRAALPG